MIAAGRGRAHHGVAHCCHDGFHVGEVAVDDARDRDDVGDTLHALAKDVVGHAERFEEARVLGDSQKLFIRNHDGGVDRFHQFVDAALGLHHAPLPFKREWLGDHGDGERAHFAGERSDDRRCAGSGSAAQTGGDEDHVSAFERFDDLVGIFERCLAADFGVGASTQPVGQFHAELNLHGRTRHAQRLQVSVCHDELNAFHTRVDHAVNGVAASATYADHFDLGIVARVFVKADADVGIVFFHIHHR